jgi:hypothetical protein
MASCGSIPHRDLPIPGVSTTKGFMPPVTVTIKSSPESSLNLLLAQTAQGAVVLLDIEHNGFTHSTSVIDTEWSRAELWNEVARLADDPHARSAEMVTRCAEALLVLARYGVVLAE